MGLNKSTGNMYPFVTDTWNVIKGKCSHDCMYCYMKRWGKQKPVHFDEKELNTNLGKGNFIFVGSSCDMWAKDIPDVWIWTVLNHVGKYPENKYLFQTKYPSRYLTPSIGLSADNTILCTTIETNYFNEQYMGKTPSPYERAEAMEALNEKGFRTMITIEPIMDFDFNIFIALIKMCEPFQVNIGADSGNNHLPEPPKEKVIELIKEIETFTTVYQKKNLRRLLNVK